MLLRFGVENCRSIRERQELSFAASSLKDRSDGLIPCDAVDSGSVVPAVVILGANASGKTSFVSAIRSMRSHVIYSHTQGAPEGGVPRHVFRLDQTYADKPSRFDIDFMIDGIRYHYGFEATDEVYQSEWLYQFPKAHRRKLFERNGNKFDFGRTLKGQNGGIAKLTRKNSLFLSAAAQNAHEQLLPIYNYFREITFVDSSSVSVPSASKAFDEAGFENRVISFLQAFDAGVVDYNRIEEDISEKSNEFMREVNVLIERIYGESMKNEIDEKKKMVEIQLTHRGVCGENIPLDLSLESAGTIKLMLILSEIFKALNKGVPIVIDELDISLHTYATENLVRLFCSQNLNKNGAQLIATSHDTNLLGSNSLRRDQFWFAEKNATGVTEMFPLTDVRTRKGDNLELGYLQGRYGAVPSNGSIFPDLDS